MDNKTFSASTTFKCCEKGNWMIDSLKHVFIEETTELLTELEATLLELENVPDDKETIAKIFRALHTIKGSSGMFGCNEISEFTHDIESVYDYVRKGEIKINKEIIDLTLAARDQISIFLSSTVKGIPVDKKQSQSIIESFRNIAAGIHPSKIKKSTSNKSENKSSDFISSGKYKIFEIRFNPFREILANGTNPVLLLNELRELGKLIAIAKFDNIPDLQSIDPEKCYISWDIILKTNKELNDIKDVFIFVEDQCELIIDDIDPENKLAKDEDFERFKKLIFENSFKKNPDIKSILSGFKHLAHLEQSDSRSIADKKEVKNITENRHCNDNLSSIRVNAEKIDELVNLVGELVTVQARLNQIALNSSETDIVSVAEEVERLTWSLRDSALNMRMLPIGTTFSKFKRLVRDLSKELGKEVELTTEGGETELDKTVIEKLNDPLIHIIRNSIDHGIELPAEREGYGKMRSGKIRLTASQSGGNVLITISDDGKGININSIKEKAVKMGLVTENSELTDSELYSIIFLPGFSTAGKVTNVSGRGVGMDVVKKAIDALRGTVQVTSSQNVGTKITLKLPLTLAIIDGLLVMIDEDYFILPLSAVEECIELTQEDVNRTHGRHYINVRGKIVPYINLRERFKIETKKLSVEQVVVAEINGNHIGFVVDKVLGQHQTVLKSLGCFYKNVDGVSGATILGDGTVAIILDIIKLVEKEELNEKKL
jgi:two-component system, chemotaxis family, sensor kinase CheA